MASGREAASSLPPSSTPPSVGRGRLEMLCYNAECSAQHSLRECPRRVREPSPSRPLPGVRSDSSSLRENTAVVGNPVGNAGIASSQPELEEDPFGEGGGTGSVTYPSLPSGRITMTTKETLGVTPTAPPFGRKTEKDPTYRVESPTIPAADEEGEDDLDALEAMKEAEELERDECHCLPYVYGEDGEHVVEIDYSICNCGLRERNRIRYGLEGEDEDFWDCFDPEGLS
jgi:hypothetical protein